MRGEGADPPEPDPVGSTSGVLREGEGPPGSSEPFRVTVDEDLKDLIPQYLDNRRKDVVKLRDALGKDDLGTVRILGHSMAGSGGGYGFPGITRIGRNLERFATERNVDAAKGAVHELELYLSRVVVEFG